MLLHFLAVTKIFSKENLSILLRTFWVGITGQSFTYLLVKMRSKKSTPRIISRSLRRSEGVFWLNLGDGLNILFLATNEQPIVPNDVEKELQLEISMKGGVLVSNKRHTPVEVVVGKYLSPINMEKGNNVSLRTRKVVEYENPNVEENPIVLLPGTHLVFCCKF